MPTLSSYPVHWSQAVQMVGAKYHGEVDLGDDVIFTGCCGCAVYEGQLLFLFFYHDSVDPRFDERKAAFDDSTREPPTDEFIAQSGNMFLKWMVPYEILLQRIEKARLPVHEHRRVTRWLAERDVVQAYLARRAAQARLRSVLENASSTK